MNTCSRQYIQQLKRSLRCCGATKKRLLQQFRDKLDGFLEETPSPNRQTLEEAFGPPEEMAKVLMETVSAGEKNRFRRQKLWLRGAVAVLVAAFLALTVYIYTMKEIPVSVEEASHTETYHLEEGQ